MSIADQRVREEPGISLRAGTAGRAIAVQAALVWAASRVALALFTYFTVIMNNPTLRVGAPGQPLTLSRGLRSPGQLVSAWAQWDSTALLHIARDGYDQLVYAAWFPLDPLLTRAVALVLGQTAKPITPTVSAGWALSGLVVSNLAMLLAFVSLSLLTYHETRDRTAAWLAPLMLSAYPYAFFLAAPYSDPLFLGLAVTAVLAARQRWWVLAVATAYLAALTRQTAVILAPLLVWEYGRQHGWWSITYWRRLPGAVGPFLRLLPGAAALALAVPAGVATYMAYLWRTHGDPLLFTAAERQGWHRQLNGPWSTLTVDVQHLAAQAAWSYWQMLFAIDLGLFLLMLGLSVVFARRLPFSFTLYMAGLLALCVILPPLGPWFPDLLSGTARFLAASFPVFLVLAQLSARRPALATLLLGTGLMTQAALATFYLSSGWLG